MRTSTTLVTAVASLLALAPGAARAEERPSLDRAIEAVLWSVPLVSVAAMRQAFFRDAGARYGDIVFWSKPADWMNQTTTPNASTYYAYFNFNTKDGPVVIDVPPAVGAGLFGSILDAWQVPLADVGPEGSDAGKGGKYLLFPPGFSGPVPPGFTPVPLRTFNGYVLLRAIPEEASAAGVARALALVHRLGIHPLGQTSPPAATRFIDMSGRLFDGIVRFDERYFAMLAGMVGEEPPMPGDAAMMRMLATLGIEKGKPFAPDAAADEQLRRAAIQAHATLVARAPGSGSEFWSDKRWRLPTTLGTRTGFTFETADGIDVAARALTYFVAYAPPKKLGKASFYLSAWVDGAGEPLVGANSYRLHVPANVPARQFWAATVYDRDTAAFIREAPRVEVSSYNRDVRRNADGSINLYFAPRPPPGKQANWVYTATGRRWFAFFRFYGPEEPLLSRRWQLPNIERLTSERAQRGRRRAAR